ncbi:ATP-binding protein [Geobacter sulfurreducens]|uniref:ATP-binding protein n=1 Tax=Geobacter sulfurreducens TaxID=35554 RepID=UPI000DBB0D07|nr:ATP-binding protein [Geobacter sulfurreducens]BBA68829.1 Sensor protein ZraS [Geobacter sulfurreducens]
MAVHDPYTILSSAIRIANATERSHDERLKTLALLIAEAFGALSATFYLLDGDSRVIVRKISSAFSDICSRDCRIPGGRGIVGLCASSGKPIRQDCAGCHPDEVVTGNERTIAAFPVSCQGQSLGVLALGFAHDAPLTDDDRDMLAVVLIEAAGVMRCKRQLESVEKRIRELSFLNRINGVMLSTIELNRLIHLLLTALTSDQPPLFDRAMLFLLNERAGILQGMMGITSARQTDSDAPPEPRTKRRFPVRNVDFDSVVKATRLPLDASLNQISRAVLERTLLHVQHPDQEQPVDRTLTKQFGTSSYAVAPLVSQDRVVGAIVVDNRLTDRPLAGDDLGILHLVSGQAGMAIENSILFHRLEETNRNLQDAKERLLQEEKLAAIGRMAASIAHEIKNPLVSVGGFAGRLKRKFTPESEEWLYADVIGREVQHLEKMLSDILFFSRKTTICYTRCGINQIIEDGLATMAVPLEQREIVVDKRFASRLPTLLGDCQQLRHVFTNLISNALDVMEPQGVLTIETGLARIDGKRAVSVKVGDTGSGIAPDVRHSIFTPFFTTKEKGTGLGLAIVHRIITNHGGRIEVENRPEGGALFTVVLPTSP